MPEIKLTTGKITPVSENFYQQGVHTLAKSLLGKIFVRKYNGELLAGEIVETEAYHQEGDPSCHAANGKTARNAVMFGPPGYLYVYFTYGMHYCMNIVAEKEGVAAAVLVRALRPLAGIETMRSLRERGKKISDRLIASGPARLCQAMALTREQNGSKLVPPDIFVAEWNKKNRDSYHHNENEITTTTRIGISNGKELPWRYYLTGSPYISKK